MLYVLLKILYCVAVLIFAAVAVIYVTYRLAFHSPQKGQNEIDNLPQGEEFEKNRNVIVSAVKKFDEREYETVEVVSFDGLKLCGRLYRGNVGAPVDLCFHGYRGLGIRDFSMGGLALINEGHNVIIVDQRACGKSQGKTITFGINERKDVLSWCKKATELFGKDCEIVLFGISMGATSVLMASSDNLTENVRCIIADCPFDDPSDIIKTVCKERKYPIKILYPFIKAGARLFGGFDLEETTASKEVKKSKVNILIVHGEADKFVLPEKSQSIRDAAPEKIKRITFPYAEHGLSFMYDKKRYVFEINKFIAENRKSELTCEKGDLIDKEI